MMNSELLFQLMVPVLSGVFALAFFGFWKRNPERKYLLALTLGFGACFLGHIVTFFLVSASPSQSHKIYSVLGYVAAIAAVSWAMHHRSNLKQPLWMLLGIACIGVPFAFWAGEISDTLNLKIILTNSTMGILLCVTAMSLRKMVRQGTAEAFLVASVAFIGLQYIFLPYVTLSIDGIVTSENYSTSVHKLSLDFSKVMSVLLLAASLFFLCVSDILTWAKENSEMDYLSGLKTRAAFEQVVDVSFTPDNSASKLTFILIDIDNFKSINDEFGHPTGDAVIKTFGGLISKATRENDAAGRVGGEEFCVMLKGLDSKTGGIIAERLRVCFAALAVPGLPIGRYVTASFGVATRKEHEDYNSLYKRADENLYHAKRAGRNRVVTDLDLLSIRANEMTDRSLATPKEPLEKLVGADQHQWINV